MKIKIINLAIIINFCENFGSLCIFYCHFFTISEPYELASFSNGYVKLLLIRSKYFTFHLACLWLEIIIYFYASWYIFRGDYLLIIFLMDCHLNVLSCALVHIQNIFIYVFFCQLCVKIHAPYGICLKNNNKCKFKVDKIQLLMHIYLYIYIITIHITIH